MNQPIAAKRTVLSVLMDTRRLLFPPEAWTKHTSARDVNGDAVAPGSRSACSFCLTGAVERVAPDDHQLQDGACYALKGSIHPVCHLPDWNDVPERTHGQVLDLLDETIIKLEQKGGV